MGPMKLHFDIRDIFRAPRLALSGKKIMIMLSGTLVGDGLYWIFTAAAFTLSGVSFNEMWSDHGLYPCLAGFVASPPWYACTVFDLGIILLFVSISLACTAVSRVTFKQLKGDEFFSATPPYEAIRLIISLAASQGIGLSKRWRKRVRRLEEAEQQKMS